MTAKTGGSYPCLTNKNCPTYAACVADNCLCRDELSGDGENCKAGQDNLIFLYLCHYIELLYTILRLADQQLCVLSLYIAI